MKRIVALFLVFISLFFFLCALGLFYIQYLTYFAWQDAKTWVETPAQIIKVQFISSQTESSGSVPDYSIKVEYHYQYEKKDYVGKRVFIQEDKSKNKNYFMQIAQELEQYKKSKKQPFNCFVNPKNPEQVVLYREMRWSEFCFYFYAEFMAIAMGLFFIYGAKRSWNRKSYQSTLRQEKEVSEEKALSEHQIQEK